MHCIDCGTQNLETTRYCSRCGANLEVLRQALTSNLSSGPLTMIGPKHVGLILVMSGLVGLGGVTVVFLGLTILANILGTSLGGGILPLLLFLGIVGIGGVVLVVMSLLKMLRAGQSAKNATPPVIQQMMLDAPGRSAVLPPANSYRQGIPSVVEHTTANLPNYAPPPPEDPRRS
ncbi:MAG TPA: zinc ribbon domain-containing protein [Blastocatellia bacterium]|nr:zinc ribbon domain-containing protein [Blastocatellia bacterium]